MSIDEVIKDPSLLRDELISTVDFILNISEKYYDKDIEKVINPKLFYLNELLLVIGDNNEVINDLFNIVSKEFNQDYKQFFLFNELLMPFYEDFRNTYYELTYKSLIIKSLLKPVIVNDEEINDFKKCVSELINNNKLQPNNLSEENLLFINSRLKKIGSYIYSIIFNNDNKKKFYKITTDLIGVVNNLFLVNKDGLNYNNLFNNLIKLDLLLNDNDDLNKLVSNSAALRRELLSISDFILNNIGEPTDFNDINNERVINQKIIRLKKIIYKLNYDSLSGLSIVSNNHINNLKSLYKLQLPFYGTKGKNFNNYSRLLIDNLVIKSLLNPIRINDCFINDFKSIVNKSLNNFLRVNPHELHDYEKQSIINSELKDFMSYVALIKFNNLTKNIYAKITKKTDDNDEFTNLINYSLQQLIGDGGSYSDWINVLMSMKYFLDNKLFRNVKNNNYHQIYI